MYKIQMLLQRIACFVMIVASTLVFLYSLGMVTDLYGNRFNWYAENLAKKEPGTQAFIDAIANVKVAGSEIFYEIQPFNRQLTVAGIVLILLAVALFVFHNDRRRKYYLVNYVLVGINAVACIGVSVWSMINITLYRNKFLQVDFDALATWAEDMDHQWTDSTFWFDAGYFVLAFAIFASLCLIGVTVYKVIVMKAEARALENKNRTEA